MGISGNLGILFRKALGSVNKDQAHVRTVYRHIGTQHAVMLDTLGDTGFFPDAGGVDEDELSLFVFHHGIRCVTGRAGNVGHDGTLFPGDAVHQRGLAYVRLADDRHVDGILIVLQLVLRRQQVIDRIQHIAGAVTVRRRDGKRVADAQVIEFVQLHRRFTDRVALVDRQHHGLATLLEHTCHGAVVCGHAAAHICHQHDHIGTLNGKFRLAAHLLEDHVVCDCFNTAGVHQHERTVTPLALGIDPVTGHAGRVLHNGEPLTDQLIKQGRLSHIGSSHHSYNR